MNKQLPLSVDVIFSSPIYTQLPQRGKELTENKGEILCFLLALSLSISYLISFWWLYTLHDKQDNCFEMTLLSDQYLVAFNTQRLVILFG